MNNGAAPKDKSNCKAIIFRASDDELQLTLWLLHLVVMIL
jgi:hypothetical protein